MATTAEVLYAHSIISGSESLSEIPGKKFYNEMKINIEMDEVNF